MIHQDLNFYNSQNRTCSKFNFLPVKQLGTDYANYAQVIRLTKAHAVCAKNH